jgi:hypothetical protein
MRVLVAVGIIAMVSGCAGRSPELSAEKQPPGEARQIQRSDKELVLDAVLHDVVNNPKLKRTRGFYGTPGDKQVALVTNHDFGVPWPADYQPTLPGWTVSRVEEGVKQDTDTPRLLGVRIDKYFQEDRKRSSFFSPAIAVTVLNAGGDRDRAVVGGCSVYYNPKQIGGKWVVEFEGLDDS